MAGKISELTAADTLTGVESIETVQGGVNKKTTLNDILSDVVAPATVTAIADALAAADVALLVRDTGTPVGFKEIDGTPIDILTPIIPDLDTLGYTTVSPTTGQLMVAGVAQMSIASMTFAQFENLTADQLLALAGLPVHISDVHTNSDGIGGVYVVRDSSPAGWAQISGPFYYTTFAVAPNPATYPGWRIRVGNIGIGGADLIARSSMWRFIDGRIVAAARHNTAISTDKTTQQSCAKVTLPINNSKNILQNGDRIYCDVHLTKSAGATDKISRSVYIGTNATTPASNTLFDNVTAGSVTSIGVDELMPITRISATSLKRNTPAGFSLNGGASTTVRMSAVTVPDMDAALQYLDVAVAEDIGTETITIESVVVYLEHCS